MAADGKGAKGAELVAAKVAKRRTIRIDGKHYGPGETVSLPATEVESLRSRGFLEKPGQQAVAEANVPRFVHQGGPSAQEA